MARLSPYFILFSFLMVSCKKEIPPAVVEYEWVSGNWGSCSVSACGQQGTQTRTVVCEKKNSDEVVANTFCTEAMPTTSQVCSTPGCPTPTYTWVAGDWGACSVTACGQSGTQSRPVTCKKNTGETVANSNCTGAAPETSQSCSTAACPPDPTTIDTSSKAAVTAAYLNWHEKPEPDAQWTGNVETCVPGLNSVAYQQRVIDQINYYRAMVGIKPATLEPNEPTSQAGALIMEANGRLSHSPGTDWKCYSQEGASGAGSSNIARGASGRYAIDLYMNDPGAGNAAAGHRRWILYPPRSKFATGDVGNSNNLKVWLDEDNPRIGEYVAWPSKGYFPFQVYPYSERWSFSKFLATINTSTTVEMKNLTTGAVIPTTIESTYPGYGDNTIVWKPVGLNLSPYSPVTGEVKIQVTVSNVIVNRQPQSYTYVVIVYDPENP